MISFLSLISTDPEATRITLIFNINLHYLMNKFLLAITVIATPVNAQYLTEERKAEIKAQVEREFEQKRLAEQNMTQDERIQKSLDAKGVYVLHIIDGKGTSIDSKKIVLE